MDCILSSNKALLSALLNLSARTKPILSPKQPETILSLGKTRGLILEMGDPLYICDLGKFLRLLLQG